MSVPPWKVLPPAWLMACLDGVIPRIAGALQPTDDLQAPLPADAGEQHAGRSRIRLTDGRPPVEQLRAWRLGHHLPIVVGVIAFAICAGALFLVVTGPPVHRILSVIGSSVPSGPGSDAGADGGGSGANPGDGPSAGQPDAGVAPARVVDAMRPDLLIIKTGLLELQVASVEGAVSAGGDVVDGVGGYVSGSEQTGEGEDLSARVTYRIPTEEWDVALAGLRGLALKVVSQTTRTDDVSTEVVDLSARILNLQATERALQAIMTRATAIDDVLEVQDELTTVRGQIEKATAERAHLLEKASFSTLTVGFGLRPEPAAVVSQERFDPATEIERASATLVDILQQLATAGIWFGIVWLPILVVLGLVGLAAFVGYRRLSRSPSGALEAPPA